MPRYDYTCTQGHTHEVLVALNEPNPYCDECGGETVRQFPKRTGVRWNGGGSSLSDVHDRNYVDMEANGEFR